jgi:hypothetical protein
MRSQVQVLAGPLPIVAGQSAADSEPGALAVGLGRAGAARPSPPAPQWPRRGRPPGRQARPRPPTVVAHPAPGRQPRGMRPPHAAACSVPTAQPPATGAPHAGLACLVAQRANAIAAARTPTRRPGSASHLPSANATWAASPASRPPRPSLEPSTARQPPGPPPVLVVRVARSPRPGPNATAWVGGDGRVRTGGGRHQTAGQRTAGQRTAGRWMGGQQTTDRRTSGRPPQVTGHRTAGQPDPGHPRPDRWTPPAGHRRPTPWRACWQGRPR